MKFVTAKNSKETKTEKDLRSCPKCLRNNNHNFHSGVVMSTVGAGPKLVIDFEMYKPGQDSVSKTEGELNAAKRLLSAVIKSHKKTIDIVVYDALVCNSVWINHTSTKIIHFLK